MFFLFYHGNIFHWMIKKCCSQRLWEANTLSPQYIKIEQSENYLVWPFGSSILPTVWCGERRGEEERRRGGEEERRLPVGCQTSEEAGVVPCRCEDLLCLMHRSSSSPSTAITQVHSVSRESPSYLPGWSTSEKQSIKLSVKRILDLTISVWKYFEGVI